MLAVAWALLLTGVADDGSNPLPLARVRAFAVDPQEHAEADLDELPGERVVLYVESDGTILDAPTRSSPTTSARPATGARS